LIVITIGLSSRAWVEALGGASLALALTVWSRRRPSRLFAEMAGRLIKLGAGLILLTLGTYWLVEGLGIKWPMDEFSALPLFGLFVLSSWIAILIMRRERGQGAM
jgi:Ca2+/H+ antiporter, TMEM165/GDT1 family